MAFPSYSTGTVSVSAGDTVVTGIGTLWTANNARPGDEILIDGREVVVMDFTDGTHLEINPWPGSTVSGVAYSLIQSSPLRYNASQTMMDVSKIVAAMNTDGFYFYVSAAETVPDPSYGNEGQYAMQATTGKLWLKSDGVWVYIGVNKGFGLPAPWSAATAYSPYDVVRVSGSTYVCILANTNIAPPNATYWQLLASKGDVGPAALKPLAAWQTGTAYSPGPPADYVNINGSSYACAVAHTSGVFATDLAGGKWVAVASKGQDGSNGLNAPTYGGVSTSSLALGTGSKAFITQANLAYTNGARVRASSAVNTSNWMEGVCNYAGTTLTMNVDKFNGTGTFSDWSFNVVGQPGAGDMSSANALSEITNYAGARGNIRILAEPQGRLTLTSALGLTISDVAGAPTIYYTPWNGNQCPIFDGTKFVMRAFAETPLALDGNAAHSLYQATGLHYDIFGFFNGTGFAVGVAEAWNNTGGSGILRGTGAGSSQLQNLNGIPVNQFAITLRFGSGAGDTIAVFANQATYLGSFRATANGQVSDTNALRFLYNAYNQQFRKLMITDPANTWSYNVTSWRQVNANGANQVSVLNGSDALYVDLTATAVVGCAISPADARTGIGIRSTTVNSADVDYYSTPSGAAPGTLKARLNTYLPIGNQFLQWLEMGGAPGGAQTWFGTNGGAQSFATGLRGQVLM